MIKNFGIDLSKWQKGFDFQRAKQNGVKFVILRAMYHTTIDVQFENFYKECKKYDIPVGCYLYTMATNKQEAELEAKKLCKLLKGKQLEYPVYIDIEDKIYKSRTKRTNTDIVKTFCDYMEKEKFFTGVYSFNSFFQNNLFNAELDRYTRWVALWDKQDYATYSHDMWQFGGETNLLKPRKVSNIAIVDQSYCYKDFPTIIKNAGLNGFSKNDLEFCIDFKY